MARRKPNEPDIKAPDGYLLGGWRKVRKDGTLLFHRMWWKCPDDWIDEYVSVHVTDGLLLDEIEAAPPPISIFAAQYRKCAVTLYPSDRPEAKRGWRKASATLLKPTNALPIYLGSSK